MIKHQDKSKEWILHENNKGIQIVRKDFVKRSCVTVQYKNRYVHRRYRMNNIPFYEHKYLSWQNLDCCNGWQYDEKYLYTAVQNEKKLVADITLYTDSDSISEARDILRKKDLRIKSNKMDVWLDKIPVRNYTGYWWKVLVVRKVTLSDYFDINEIAEAYGKQDVIMDKGKAAGYFRKTLLDLYGRHANKFDFVNPKDEIEFIIDGLGLGYPAYCDSKRSLLRG